MAFYESQITQYVELFLSLSFGWKIVHLSFKFCLFNGITSLPTARVNKKMKINTHMYAH